MISNKKISIIGLGYVGLPLAISYAESGFKVLGIDIDIRPHNKKAIQEHPLSQYIELLQGSSIENDIFKNVKNFSRSFKNILVILDSNHTHEHVLQELKLYAPLTSLNSYCLVFDTAIEDLPKNHFPDRPWGHDNNPKTAVREFLSSNKEFIIDRSFQEKLMITVAPEGFLKKVL